MTNDIETLSDTRSDESASVTPPSGLGSNFGLIEKLLVAFLVLFSTGIRLSFYFSDERVLIRAAQRQASNKLRDPASAQFRSMQVKNKNTVCGEINGKNIYGAYTGFQSFAAQQVVNDIWIIEFDERDSLVYKEYCN